MKFVGFCLLIIACVIWPPLLAIFLVMMALLMMSDG